MTATLAQLRGAQKAARAAALEELQRLDKQRAALALDDPKALEDLDGERVRLQVAIDHADLALEELDRRDVAEAEAEKEQWRKGLASQLAAALAQRKKAATAAVQLAEALGDALCQINDLDATISTLSHPHNLDVAGAVRTVGAVLRAVVRQRLGWVHLAPGDTKDQEGALAAWLDMAPGKV
jgi:hypothetical protein